MDTQPTLNQTLNNDTQAQTQVNNTEPQQPVDTFSFDLSTLWKENEAGVYDDDKITQLAKDLENQKKSTSYFQSMYMKKNPVPDTIEGYEKNFKPDSMYEKALEFEEVKTGLKEFREWALKNKIGEREANLFADWVLKDKVQTHNIDLRSEEDIAVEKQKAYEEGLKEVQPMLDSLGRSIEENNRYIDNFLKSPSAFSNNPEMIKYIENIANGDPMGYKFVTLLTQLVDHKDLEHIPTGTYTKQDKADLQQRLIQEPDPEKRFRMMQEFFKEEL